MSHISWSTSWAVPFTATVHHDLLMTMDATTNVKVHNVLTHASLSVVDKITRGQLTKKATIKNQDFNCLEAG